MNARTVKFEKNPASLVMFGMMGLALAASQMHESEMARSAIQPVVIKLQSSIEELDGLHRALLEAKELTATGAALVVQRVEGRKP